MKKAFCEIVEKGRMTKSPFFTQRGSRYGAFELTCPKTGGHLRVIVNDAETFNEEIGGADGWDHVSVSLERRCPTWDEMCWIKELFFDDTECVVQYHPSKSDYINEHPFVLHLWKPGNGVVMPMPPKICV